MLPVRMCDVVGGCEAGCPQVSGGQTRVGRTLIGIVTVCLRHDYHQSYQITRRVIRSINWTEADKTQFYILNEVLNMKKIFIMASTGIILLPP